MSSTFQKVVTGIALWVSLNPMIVLADTANVPAQNQIESRIALSGKSPNLIVDQDKFAEQLFATSTIKLGYTQEPVNNLYVFFDPTCINCQGIKAQLASQSELYAGNKVNVHIIPVGATSKGRMKAVHLYVDDAGSSDKTVSDIKALVNRNTELYTTSFDDIGTPLVVWQTETGFEALKGFPSQSTNSAFLKIVAQKKGIANWIMELSGVNK